MRRLLGVELLKLRTVRTPYGLLAALVVMTVIFCAIESTKGYAGTGGVASLPTLAGQTTVTTITAWAIILAAVLGVLVSAGEMRHGAVLTYSATPKRHRALLAQAGAAGVAGAIFGLCGGATSTVVGLAFVVAHGDAIVLGAPAMVGHIGGAMLGAALWAAIGVGVGALVRSQVVGVIVVLLWAVLIESFVGGVFPSSRPYLPYTAATTLAGTKLGGAAFGPAHGIAGSAPLPFVAAAALVLAVALSVGLVAAGTTLRRDIA
jgi:ABC-2 type transport system permease protein